MMLCACLRQILTDWQNAGRTTRLSKRSSGEFDAMALTGLWKNQDFVKLWLGQTISNFGSGITGIALPLTAVLVLGATPAQMGILGAVDGVSILLVGLLAGVWVDRVRRRPLLIATDLGRALVLSAIPLAALLGMLRLWQL